MAAAEKKAARAAKEAEEMRTVDTQETEAREKASVDEVAKEKARQKDTEENFHLWKRKRKATAEPQEAFIIVAEEIPSNNDQEASPGSPPSLWASSKYGFPFVQVNVFSDDSSMVGGRIFKSLLTPAEEAHICTLRPTQKFFEASNRFLQVSLMSLILSLLSDWCILFIILFLLQGTHIFISAFEEVAVVAQRERFRVRFSRDIYEQIQREFDRTWVVHSEEMSMLKTISDERL